MTKAQARQQAKDLVAKMTVEERLSQLVYNSPAIERLGIDEYNWWNEGSHGVARAGTATVFPHAIAMGATFDPDGKITLYIGGHQPDSVSDKLLGYPCLKIEL